MNKVRRALTIGGPTFIHSLDPCPKGWDYDPMLSHEMGELAIETVIRDPGFLAAIDDVLAGSDEAEVNLQFAGPPARAFGGRIVPCRWHERAA
ncbi:MAG: hypothetical protein HC855_04220, partial [Rhizobiales bacterium]|nr:hypothetical protein [Hyphomicrobiales bacterium]